MYVYLPKRNKNISSYKCYMWTSKSCGIIPYSQKVETTQMSVTQWICKQMDCAILQNVIAYKNKWKAGTE